MRAVLLALILLAAGIASAAPRNFVIAEVRINGIAHAPAMISITPEGDILGRHDDVTSWNIDVRSAPREMLQSVDHVRLTALRGISAHFDGVTLTVEVSASAFQETRVDLQKKPALTLDGGAGAYINYDLSSFARHRQRAISAAAVEAIIYADTLSFASNGIYSNARPGREFVRYETNVRWDFPDQVRSLVVGDAIGRSGAIARAFRFGGISIGTNFSTRPDMVTYALPIVPGESRIPTSAELLINGQAHSRFDLAPGPFEISNVPAINGAGEIQLLTRDPLGRQQLVVLPYYVTPALLRAGLTDAGFEIGKVREDFGLENFRYGRPFARGLVRHGVTPSVTVDAFAESDGRQHVASAGLTTNVWNLAVVGAAVAVSASGEGNAAGNSFSASLERSTRGLSFGLRGQYASRNFSQIGETPGLHYRVNGNAGFSLGLLGSVSLVQASESRYGRSRIATTAVNYQKQIGKAVSVLVNFSATRSDERLRHFTGVALVMPLDALASASLSSTRQNGITEDVIDVRQNLSADDGWAARARVTGGNAHSARVDSGLTWQNALGQLSADTSYARRSGDGSVRLGMNGSLVMVGDVPRPVRQLGEAFAIVAVPGYPGIDVFHENQRIATTDTSGFAIIPRLRPYESNAVSLDSLKLSLSTELRDPRRRITPPRRAGVVLQFKASETRGALVQVLLENGDPVPAGAQISLQGVEPIFPFAANGQAWVTGLDADKDAIISWGNRRCAVQIPAPDQSKARPRIGPLTCRSF